MSTDIILFEGKNELGFDDTVSVKLVELNKAAKEKLSIVEGKDFEFNRKVLEKKNVDILLSPEKKVKKDAMHHRNSGLNQVLCKLAKKNDIAIGFSFNDVLLSKQRKLLLGRMMQNVKFCRKYKLKMVLGSFAKNKWEVRSKEDLECFAKSIGMTGKEAKESLTNIEKILKEKKEKWVRKGVRLVE